MYARKQRLQLCVLCGLDCLTHRLDMELDLQRLFGLHVYSCTIHTIKIVLGNILEEALSLFF
jgi:hypothetical protein